MAVVVHQGAEFGQLLRTFRLERGLSEADVARAMADAVPDLRVTSSWVSWVESGRIGEIDESHLVAAAVALGVPVSALLPPIASEPVQKLPMRAQLEALGLDEAHIARIGQRVDLDADGMVWACAPGYISEP